MKKLNIHFVAFLQALGVALYCLLTSGLFSLADRFFESPPAFFAAAIMLVLLVFSAAATGSMVFGYSACLFLKGRINQSLRLFAYTLLYLLIMIVLSFVALAF